MMSTMSVFQDHDRDEPSRPVTGERGYYTSEEVLATLPADIAEAIDATTGWRAHAAQCPTLDEVRAQIAATDPSQW